MAASAFRIDEPAAPITAKNEVSYSYPITNVYGGKELTVAAQRNKLQVKDTIPSSARTLPTLTVYHLPRSRSNLGCGRSSSSKTLMGGLGAEGHPSF